jgi:hypothetical protein
MKWFTLVLSVLCLIVPAVVAAAQTGDEYLEHIYVALNGELTIYNNPDMTKLRNSVETDALLTIDQFYERGSVAYIIAPEHLVGYVNPKELIEVMAVWSDTLNIREEVGLSARKLRTAKRGEAVFFADPSTYFEYYSPPEVDGYYWRKCLIGDTSGWVADDFLIEKCYFDVLEPALEFYDAGELKNMRTYLEELDRNYADIDCEIASDNRSAVVVLGRGSCHYEELWVDTDRAYLVGEPDKMIYANRIFEHCISDGGEYTFILYDAVSYGVGGVGGPCKYPYAVFNNHTDEKVLHAVYHYFLGEELPYECTYPFSFSHLTDEPQEFDTSIAEFINNSHLLVLEHIRIEGLRGEFPRLVLIDLTTGETTVLLEHDEEWLGFDVECPGNLGSLHRNSNCSSPSPIIEAAMNSYLFRLCEEKQVSGMWEVGG